MEAITSLFQTPTISVADRQTRINYLWSQIAPLFYNDSTQDQSYFRDWCNEDCLKNFLEVEEWDVVRAEKRLKATIQWRNVTLPHHIRPSNIWRFVENPIMYDHGFDLQGRSIVYVRPRYDLADMMVQDKVDLVLFFLERCLNRMKQKTGASSILFVVDCLGANFNFNQLQAFKEIVNTSHANYPGIMGRLILLRPPNALLGFLNEQIRPLMDAISWHRVVHVPNHLAQLRDTLLKFIAPDVLEAEFGGNNREFFNHTSYYQQLEKDHEDFLNKIHAMSLAPADFARPLSVSIVTPAPNNNNNNSSNNNNSQSYNDPFVSHSGNVRLAFHPPASTSALLQTPDFNPNLSSASSAKYLEGVKVSSGPTVLNNPDPLMMMLQNSNEDKPRQTVTLKPAPPPRHRDEPLMLQPLDSLQHHPSWTQMRNQLMPNLTNDGKKATGGGGGGDSVQVLFPPRYDQTIPKGIPRSITRAQMVNQEGPRTNNPTLEPMQPWQGSSWNNEQQQQQQQQSSTNVNNTTTTTTFHHPLYSSSPATVVHRPGVVDWDRVKDKIVSAANSSEMLQNPQDKWPLFVL